MLKFHITYKLKELLQKEQQQKKNIKLKFVSIKTTKSITKVVSYRVCKIKVTKKLKQ